MFQQGTRGGGNRGSYQAILAAVLSPASAAASLEFLWTLGALWMSRGLVQLVAMKLNQAIIAWTPPGTLEWRFANTAGKIWIGRLFDGREKRIYVPGFLWSTACLCMDKRWGEITDDAEAVTELLRVFHDLVVGHNMDPMMVHKAFIVIDEWAGRPVDDLQ